MKTGDPSDGTVGSNPTLSAISPLLHIGMRKYPRGRRGSPAKGVGWETGARVQIPPSAPKVPYLHCFQCKYGTFLSYLFQYLCVCNPSKVARNHAKSYKAIVYWLPHWLPISVHDPVIIRRQLRSRSRSVKLQYVRKCSSPGTVQSLICISVTSGYRLRIIITLTALSGISSTRFSPSPDFPASFPAAMSGSISLR